MTRRLRVVPATPLHPPAGMLGELVPAMIEAERKAQWIRDQVLEQGRLLAKERGVAFIREERLRQEFGPCQA